MGVQTTKISVTATSVFAIVYVSRKLRVATNRFSSDTLYSIAVAMLKRYHTIRNYDLETNGEVSYSEDDSHSTSIDKSSRETALYSASVTRLTRIALHENKLKVANSSQIVITVHVKLCTKHMAEKHASASTRKRSEQQRKTFVVHLRY